MGRDQIERGGEESEGEDRRRTTRREEARRGEVRSFVCIGFFLSSALLHAVDRVGVVG